MLMSVVVVGVDALLAGPCDDVCDVVSGSVGVCGEFLIEQGIRKAWR
jgi:hypothetical protein